MSKIPIDDLIVIAKSTLDKILELENSKASTLIALYVLYYYTGRWQKTNQPWANDVYVSKKLGISCTTARKYRGKLEELGLIESITKKKDVRGRFTKPYVKVKHIFKKETVNQIIEQQIITGD